MGRAHFSMQISWNSIRLGVYPPGIIFGVIRPLENIKIDKIDNLPFQKLLGMGWAHFSMQISRNSSDLGSAHLV